MPVNKTLITLGFLILILGAIVGIILLSLFRPDSVQTFTNAMLTILGVATATIVTIYGLGTQGEKLRRIESNTNGNLSAMVEENQRLTNIIIDAGLDPHLAGEHRSFNAGDHRAPGPAS